MRPILAMAGLATLVAACNSGVEGNTTAANSAPVTAGNGVETPAEPDACDPASGQARLKATFDRTADCAVAALTAGLADKVRLAGQSVQDTKRIVDAIKAFAGMIVVRDISSARAIMCVQAVSGYATSQTIKNALKRAAAGLSDGDIDGLWTNIEGSFSLGVSSVFVKLGEVDDDPSVEHLVGFLTTFAASIGAVGKLVTTCGSVLAEYGTVSIPSVAAYAERFAQIGVAASIAKCGFAVVGNSLDVAKELCCYAKDLEHLRDQYATLQRMNDARCENFASLVDNPAILPLVSASGDTSDARRTACYQVIHHWGSCLYGARVSGTFGSSALSCDECARACTGYVNGAGPNAYLQPVLDGGYAATGADGDAVQRLVQQAARTCGSDVLPDGLAPCVHFCRGQVSDCP